MRKIKKIISVVLAASLLVGTLVTGNGSVQAAGTGWQQIPIPNILAGIMMVYIVFTASRKRMVQWQSAGTR